MKFLGYTPETVLRETIDNYGEALSRMANEKNVLKSEIFSLKDQLSKEKDKQIKSFVSLSVGDPSPVDTEQRKAYVAQVAGFFKEIMDPKLNQMLSVAHNLLEETSNGNEYDLVLKGVTFSYRDLMKWGQSMVNEHVSNQTSVKDDVSVEEVKTLQEKLNEI